MLTSKSSILSEFWWHSNGEFKINQILSHNSKFTLTFYTFLPPWQLHVWLFSQLLPSFNFYLFSLIQHSRIAVTQFQHIALSGFQLSPMKNELSFLLLLLWRWLDFYYWLLLRVYIFWLLDFSNNMLGCYFHWKVFILL